MSSESVEIALLPKFVFDRVRNSALPVGEKLSLLGDMARFNTFNAVKRAGSGHLGSSFSAMDIVVHLYEQEMNTWEKGFNHPDRDIYFSSKGHDVPGFYAIQHSKGIISSDQLLMLRRLGGLDGHPDIDMPAVEANTGSLGMGISKGRGMAWAKRAQGRGGRVFVLTGDGEWQEGQNFEALQTTVQQKIANLTVIVDHNKVQTDKLVTQIVDLGDLEEKFRVFGWHVVRCNGHDHNALASALATIRHTTDRPSILIADTIKGKGVSFMEHPQAMIENNGLYAWHSGSPADGYFIKGQQELLAGINHRLAKAGLTPAETEVAPPLNLPPSGVSDEFVAVVFGQTLVDLAPRHPELVVLDADLSADCRVRLFEEKYPDRFIENGIAEQDMVSMAGGIAAQGMLPVVNSFASFLASRSNEQIYNNASETKRAIYACHYAGLIPAGPGKSHQSIRDISLLGAIPNCTILQPCNAKECEMVVRYMVEESVESCAIRLIIGPSPIKIVLPENYVLRFGTGVALTEGQDATLVAYGPVMMHEALKAARKLAEKGTQLRVINMPWLNRVDGAWLLEMFSDQSPVYVLEDHGPVGGLGDFFLGALSAAGLMKNRRFHKFAVEGYPAFGTPVEVLRHHRLDGDSLAERIHALA